MISINILTLYYGEREKKKANYAQSYQKEIMIRMEINDIQNRKQQRINKTKKLVLWKYHQNVQTYRQTDKKKRRQK